MTIILPAPHGSTKAFRRGWEACMNGEPRAFSGKASVYSYRGYDAACSAIWAYRNKQKDSPFGNADELYDEAMKAEEILKEDAV